MKREELGRYLESAASEALRDHGTPGRIDAVWQRIDEAIAPYPVRRRGHSRLGWAAVVFAAFVLGVYVGQPGSSPSVELAVSGDDTAFRAEPRAQEPELRGSGAPAGAADARGRGPQGERVRVLRRRESGVKQERGVIASPTGEPALESPGNEAPVADWQRLAEGGDYDGALLALGGSGGFDSVIEAGTAEQLMLLVDVARATGLRQRAVQALRRVISRHGSDPLAPLAAWSLGNLLEKAGDPGAAAEAFALYRALSPAGDFAEDALAREVRAAVSDSNVELANRLAAQYERDFPNGRRAHEIKEQLSRLASRGDPQAAGDGGLEAPSSDIPEGEEEAPVP